MRECMWVKLLCGAVLKAPPIPPTPTPLVCAAHRFLRITEWFSLLRADGRLCQFSTLEESQISDLEYSQISDMM